MWKKLGRIFHNHHAQLPTPIVLGDIIRLFYSSKKDNKSYINFIDINSNFEVINLKNNVLNVGKRGCFDDSGVMPSCIIIKDNKYYLFYSGWNIDKGNVPYGHGIGLAVSDDCENFYRYSDGPLIDRSVHNPYLSNSLFVSQEDDIYYGYYCHGTGWHDNVPMYNLYRCESKDLLNWSNYCHFYGDLDIAISRPCLFNGSLFYSWKRKDSKYNLHCSNYDNLYLSENEWDSEMMCYPYVIKYNDLIYMFYNGNGYGETGIGVATWV